MISLRDQVILITGASSGIGLELARQCSQRGAKVALAARSEGPLKKLRDEISERGGEALVVPADVTQSTDIQRMINQTLECWGRLDILVNNAGFGMWGLFEQLSMEEIRRNFETNVFAAAACSQAAIAQFRKQKSGLIVNIESIVALRAMPFSSCYSATKHALHAFSEAMRVEYATQGIRVLSVCPGLIHTPFHQNRVQVGTHVETGPKWLYMPVEKCVAQIIRAIEEGRSRITITGHARFIALVQRISPRLVDWILAKNYRSSIESIKDGSA